MYIYLLYLYLLNCSVHLYLSVHPFFQIYFSIYPIIYLSIYSSNLSIYSSIYPSIYHLSIHLTILLFHLSINHLSNYLSIHSISFVLDRFLVLQVYVKSGFRDNLLSFSSSFFQIFMLFFSLLTTITFILGKSGYEIIKKILQKTNDNIIMVVKNSTKCIELYGGDLLKYKYR